MTLTISDVTLTTGGIPMARKTTFSAKPRSAADKANPFFDFMSPAERKWAASNIKKVDKANKRAAKGGGS